MKPLKRPMGASMIIAYGRKLPEEEAAAIGFDELRSSLMDWEPSSWSEAAHASSEEPSLGKKE